MMKWIGGASAALLLAFGGATLASDLWQPKEAEASAARIENAVPVDPAALGSVQPDVVEIEDDGLSATLLASEATTADENGAQLQQASFQTVAADDEEFVVKRVLDIDGPIKYGEWFWDTEGVPPGKLVITVDLDARVISIFQGGYEIGAAAAMLGTDKHPTPTGTFKILTKERHNVSEKYGNAPMPWTLRLTWDGIAIHGGSEVENGYASHGCIAIPDDLASRLFAIAKKGDTVIITRGETLQMGDTLL
ncbi:L,D-transpeptidase family protein [Qipengyuania sp. JC766]|uniref:L,D-transpeptidase family protein n=1 Tax=Qipengyuania sp. JC766 TaxID=3232139 RepID=UPI0034594457